MVEPIFALCESPAVAKCVEGVVRATDEYGPIVGALENSVSHAHLLDDLVVENAINSIIYAERWP